MMSFMPSKSNDWRTASDFTGEPRKFDGGLDRSSERCPVGERARKTPSVFTKIGLMVVSAGIANVNGDPPSSTISATFTSCMGTKLD